MWNRSDPSRVPNHLKCEGYDRADKLENEATGQEVIERAERTPGTFNDLIHRIVFNKLELTETDHTSASNSWYQTITVFVDNYRNIMLADFQLGTRTFHDIRNTITTRHHLPTSPERPLMTPPTTITLQHHVDVANR